MNKEEIKAYLKRVDELELKLTGEYKDTYQWLLFGYNECARLLEEKEQENNQLKEEYYKQIEEYQKACDEVTSDKMDLENTIKELRSWLEEMLDNEKDIFSVVRVKDVLSKLNELEGGKND